MALLDAARSAFEQGDYAAALAQCDQAIAKLPNDAVLHEFRGLVLFALKRYKEAAGTIYAVLSVGPGWDWTTLSSFYPDVDVYTEQLRALEQYVNANPNAADVRFLLAYHYLTCGHTDAAADAIQGGRATESQGPVVGPTPQRAYDDNVAPEQPAASAPAKPVDASALVGNGRPTAPTGPPSR